VLNTAALRGALGGLLDRTDVAARVAADPVRYPRRYARREDREVVALLSALLAFGRVAAFTPKLEALLARLGPRPADLIRGGDPEALARGFVHRWVREEELARLLSGVQATLGVKGSLGAAFRSAAEGGGGARAVLARFRSLVASRAGPGRPSRAFEAFFPDPSRGSACKRGNLFLRWLVRPDDGVDLGLWSAPRFGPADLVVPLDAHVARISRYLGLTRRAAPDWRMAEEVTGALRAVDPADPVRYDFAICHLGMSGDCPTRLVRSRCARCPLLGVCRRGARAARSRARRGCARALNDKYASI